MQVKPYDKLSSTLRRPDFDIHVEGSSHSLQCVNQDHARERAVRGFESLLQSSRMHGHCNLAAQEDLVACSSSSR